MKFLHNTKLITNLSIVITTISVSYFLISLTNIQQEEMTLKRENIIKFEECLIEAYKEYSHQWNFQCSENKKQENCNSLPRYVSDEIINRLRGDKLSCAQLYNR